MNSTEATAFDRKSGGAEGPAVRPGSRTKVSVPLALPQNRKRNSGLRETALGEIQAKAQRSHRNSSSNRRFRSLLRAPRALGYDQRDIVVLLLRAELLYFFHHEREQSSSGQFAVLLQRFQQALFPELFSRRVEGFSYAIGIKHQRV